MASPLAPILAQMHALELVTTLAEELERRAPGCPFASALRDARRYAHPACTDPVNNPDLHAAYARTRGLGDSPDDDGVPPADTRVE